MGRCISPSAPTASSSSRWRSSCTATGRTARSSATPPGRAPDPRPPGASRDRATARRRRHRGRRPPVFRHGVRRRRAHHGALPARAHAVAGTTGAGPAGAATRWSTRTAISWCTATSSRPTSSSTGRDGSACSTSARPRGSTRPRPEEPADGARGPDGDDAELRAAGAVAWRHADDGHDVFALGLSVLLEPVARGRRAVSRCPTAAPPSATSRRSTPGHRRRARSSRPRCGGRRQHPGSPLAAARARRPRPHRAQSRRRLARGAGSVGRRGPRPTSAVTSAVYG